MMTNVSPSNGVPESVDDDFQNEIESNVTCFHNSSRMCGQVTETGSSPAPPVTREQSDDHLDEPIDPRVQIELETLNTLTELINKMELELDDARADFRLNLSSSSTKLKQLAGKLGSCIERARPYYEARVKSKELQNETQKAAIRYERAMSDHAAAKEMVKQAEEGLMQQGKVFDPAWQEMLNHATCRVNLAEEERSASQSEHMRTSSAFIQAEKHVSTLQSQLKRPIIKARSYYEMKAQFNQKMDEKIRKIKELESKVSKAKCDYSNALRRLEGISCEIHERRKCSIQTMKTNQEIDQSNLRDKIRGLNISQSPARPSAIVNPWLCSTAASNSSSSCHASSDDCFSDSESIDTIDTLDDHAISNLMLDPEISSHVSKCMQIERDLNFGEETSKKLVSGYEK